METKTEVLKIEDFEDKKAKNGKRYTRFKTQLGWMSAFEKEVIEPLKDLEGKKAECEIAIDGEKGFKNIRQFHKEIEESETEATAKAKDEGMKRLQPEVMKLQDGKPKKDFHLTAEAVRIGALEAAIKVTKKTGTEDYPTDLFNNFKTFENWILTGER